MSYRCHQCHTIVGPNVGLIRHILWRTKKEVDNENSVVREHKEIAKELPVCPSCAEELKKNTP